MEDLESVEHEFDPEFYKTLVQCKVPIELQQHLVDAGYTEASVFAFAFSSSQDLDNYLQKIAETDALGDDWLRSPAASSVRWLFHRVSREVKSEDASHSVPTSKSYTSSMDNLLDLAWADLPPARVKEADSIEMKKKFSNKYPSEFLSPTNSPCSRYIAQIAQQQNRGAYHWIPWKEIISESRWLELLEKGKKRQKLEGIILYDATMDLDEDDLSAAPFFINSLLETRSIAMALVGLCHLSQSKKYNAQFMKLYTSRSQDSNLRPPNLKEAQSADREFWTDVFALVNESPDSWQVESAIIEVLTVRNSLSVNLMQRPKLLGKGPGLWNPKGKGLEKEKGKRASIRMMLSQIGLREDHNSGPTTGQRNQRRVHRFVIGSISTIVAHQTIVVIRTTVQYSAMVSHVGNNIVPRITRKTDRSSKFHPGP